MHIEMNPGDTLSVQFEGGDGEVKIEYPSSGLRITCDVPDSSDRVGTLYHEDAGPEGYEAAGEDSTEAPPADPLPCSQGPVSHKALMRIIDELATSDDNGGPVIRVTPTAIRAGLFGGPSVVQAPRTYFISVEGTTTDREGYNRDRYALRAAFARNRHL